MMKTVFLSLALFFTLTATALWPETGWAQENAEVVNFSSALFDEWSKALQTRTIKALGKSETAQIELELVKAQSILAERLRQERWTTDASISNIVDAWMEYESPRPSQDGKRDAQGHLFSGSIACMDQLIPLLQNRELLQARLHSRKGYFLYTDRRFAEASVEYEKSLSVYAPLSSEVELSRIGNMTLLANMQVTLGNKEKADAMYLEILSVPWVFVSDKKSKESLKDVQTRAGSALIRLRQSDLRSLQKLYPVTTTIPRLREELDAAIKAATVRNSSSEGKFPSDIVNQQNLRELQAIDSLGRAKNLEALAKLVAELSKRADHESPHFFNVLQALSNALTTYDHGANTYIRSYQLAQECAYLALEQANKLSLSQEVGFLWVLTVDTDAANKLTDEEKAKLRAKKAALMLNPIKRINEIKKMPAYKGVIFTTVPLPPGVEGENGMSPKNISNPVLRAQYEKAVKENSERLKQANLRRQALNTEISWLPAVEKYLIAAYTKPPFALDELKNLMDQAEMPSENKNRILGAVTTQFLNKTSF